MSTADYEKKIKYETVREAIKMSDSFFAPRFPNESLT